MMTIDVPPREAVRRSYVIDDFRLWDRALHQAASEFHATYGAYPTHALAHPSALTRFLGNADPEALRDEDGAAPEAGVDPADGVLDVFETEDYAIELVEDASLWPITVALLILPPGASPPAEDTPPRPTLAAVSTDLDRPFASRPLYTRILYHSSQCWSCRHILGAGSCAAFPAGIPLALQQSRADHRDPFHGDGGLRFEPSIDPRAPWDGPWLFFEADRSFRFRRVDSPDHLPDPAPAAGWVGDAALAPVCPPKETIVARVKALVRETLTELGGAEAIEAHPLSAVLQARYPTTVAIADHQIRGGYQRWRVLVARCLAGRRTAARRALST